MSSVLTEVRQHVGYITLNRPAALNSLNAEMIGLMHAALKRWEHDPNVAAVVVRGAGEKAFCAGGDIRAVYEDLIANDESYLNFFYEEFELDQYIYRYPKPYIAWMDGYVMGGGMGISQGGSFRIVSERSKISMPEVGIGYFPDVGGSYFISRCPGATGLYLGITGSIVHAQDAIYAGLADWILPSEKFDLFLENLESLDVHSFTNDQISEIFKKIGANQEANQSFLKSHRELIDRHFAHQTIPDIMRSLESETQPENMDWAKKILEIMRKRSPISMAVTQVLLHHGKHLTLEQCFDMEYGLLPKWMKEGDFVEGVRALIVDKDNQPKWKHRPEDLSAEFIHSFFTHVPN